MPTLATQAQSNPFLKVTEQTSMAEHERRKIKKMEREMRAKKKKKAEQTQIAKKVKDAAHRATIKTKAVKANASKAGKASNADKVCNHVWHRIFNADQASNTDVDLISQSRSPSPRLALRWQHPLCPALKICPLLKTPAHQSLVPSPMLRPIPIARLATRRKHQPRTRSLRRCVSVARACVPLDTRTMPIARQRKLFAVRQCPPRTGVRSWRFHCYLDRKVREVLFILWMLVIHGYTRELDVPLSSSEDELISLASSHGGADSDSDEEEADVDGGDEVGCAESESEEGAVDGEAETWDRGSQATTIEDATDNEDFMAEYGEPTDAPAPTKQQGTSRAWLIESHNLIDKLTIKLSLTSPNMLPCLWLTDKKMMRAYITACELKVKSHLLASMRSYMVGSLYCIKFAERHF